MPVPDAVEENDWLPNTRAVSKDFNVSGFTSVKLTVKLGMGKGMAGSPNK